MKNYNERHFIIVDDAKSILSMFDLCFNELGITNYKSFISGEEALKYYEGLPEDKKVFIISDLNMPDFTGLEFLEAVRKKKNRLDLPFLVISAENERSSIMDVMEKGANLFILKPFTTTSLKRKLDHFF